MAELVTNILIGLGTGLLTGCYSGWIVARASRFYAVRGQILHILRRTDYMEESGRIDYGGFERLPEFMDFASELFYLKHKRAGMDLLDLKASILAALDRCEKGTITGEEMRKLDAEWQTRCRGLRANPIAILITGRL